MKKKGRNEKKKREICVMSRDEFVKMTKGRRADEWGEKGRKKVRCFVVEASGT